MEGIDMMKYAQKEMKQAQVAFKILETLKMEKSLLE